MKKTLWENYAEVANEGVGGEKRFAAAALVGRNCFLTGMAGTGKSLHAWFDAPRDKVREGRLKAGLEVFGCDPKVFTYSQPGRVPGAWREGRLQRLIWLRD